MIIKGIAMRVPFSPFFKHLYIHCYNVALSQMHLTQAEEKLIRQTQLFDKLNSADFKELLQNTKRMKYLKGDLILREGDKGDALYIICSGSVCVFTEDLNHKKIILARLIHGDYFGEQALLDQANKTRNASIIADSDVELLKIKDKFLIKILHIDVKTRKKLEKIGYQQLNEKYSACLKLYNTLVDKEKFFEEYKIKKFEKDQIIYALGAKPDYLYFVLSGSVRVIMPDSKDPGGKRETIICAGHIFGEFCLISQRVRNRMAIAEEHTEVLCIEMKKLIKMCERNKDMQALFANIKSLYELPRRGSVLQYLGKFSGMDCITSIYKLKSGRAVMATRALTEPYFNMTSMNKTVEDSFQYAFDENNKVQIGLNKQKFLVHIDCIGKWPQLQKACKFLLDGEQVRSTQLDRFAECGELFFPLELEEQADQQIVCECLSVSKGTLSSLIENGVDKFEELQQQTGCSTVCGSCKHQVLEMLGETSWLSAELSLATKHNDLIASYNIKPLDGAFDDFVPGQHVIVQAQIADRWLERSYTISGKSNDKLRITIKKDVSGLLTNWLFAHESQHLKINVSQPQGEFNLSEDEDVAALCFAGGIGITPFIAFADDLAQGSSSKKLHIIYQVRDKSDAIFLEEFSDACKKNSNITFEVLSDVEHGMITSKKVKEYVDQYANSDIYICGPEGFENIILSVLNEVNYPIEKIHVENFFIRKKSSIN
jgi:ferredoxin-NADP reductase/CRP-like cAMP-binding protein